MKTLCATIYVSLTALLFLPPTLGHSSRSAQHREVIDYLADYGYLISRSDRTYTNYELGRSLRLFQRENNLRVNGKITPETSSFIKLEKNKETVVKYLKTFGYLQGEASPFKLAEAVKLLQRNSGVLNVTGSIDSSTIDFVQTNQHGYYVVPEF